MIRMSKLADYSFVILNQMMSAGGEPSSASDLATKTTLPLPTVAKLMKMLAKNGLVTAHRGATGGYRLALPPESISIARIIEAVDGPITLTECVDETEPACAVQRYCPMYRGWGRVNEAMRHALENVFLADMVGCPSCTCHPEPGAATVSV